MLVGLEQTVSLVSNFEEKRAMVPNEGAARYPPLLGIARFLSAAGR